MIPVFATAGPATQFQAQDQADVVEGGFGEQALKAGPLLDGATAAPLIVVDD
jgi:hypothetical protein